MLRKSRSLKKSMKNLYKQWLKTQVLISIEMAQWCRQTKVPFLDQESTWMTSTLIKAGKVRCQWTTLKSTSQQLITLNETVLKFSKCLKLNAPKAKLALWLSNLQTRFKKTSLLVLLQLCPNRRDSSSTSRPEQLPHPQRIQDTTIKWASTRKMSSKLMKKIKKAVVAMMQQVKCLCLISETVRHCRLSHKLMLRLLRIKKCHVSQRVRCNLIQVMKSQR